MSEDGPTGYVEAAEVLSTRQDEYQECDDLSDVLPDSFRVVEISDGCGSQIERETTHAGRWIPVAEFTEPDAKYEWGDEIHSALDGGEYRCVVDRCSGDVFLEAWYDE